MSIFSFFKRKPNVFSEGQLVSYKSELSNKNVGVVKAIKDGKARVVTLNGGISYHSQWIDINKLKPII